MAPHILPQKPFGGPPCPQEPVFPFPAKPKINDKKEVFFILVVYVKNEEKKMCHSERWKLRKVQNDTGHDGKYNSLNNV